MLPSLLIMPAFALAQECTGRCPGPEPSMPSGACCPSDGFCKEADPQACSFYYDCVEGTVTHKQCKPLADGLPRVFNAAMGWCAYRDEVDCGSRPCNDEGICSNQPPCKTTTTSPDCGPVADCKELGDGYFPDPYNCRKYWHCYNGEGEHHICPNDPATGEPMLYDLVYDGCNFQEYTDCGDRPVCDNCYCDCGPADHHPDDICVGKTDGWYPDEFNCAKCWHCDLEEGTHYMCAPGLVWETDKETCDWPDRVDCGDRPTCDQCDGNCH